MRLGLGASQCPHHRKYEMEHSTKLHELLELASHSTLDMTIADEPELKHLYAERVALDARIHEMQRTAALEKGVTPITPSDICEVLQTIFQSRVEETKRGMVQKKAGGKADVYSRILDYRITSEIAQSIPKRDELIRVFGDNFSSLAAPVGSKINQVIPRVRLLLDVATEVLSLRAELQEAKAEIQDCHAQIEHGLDLSIPTKSTRGRRSKLDDSEVQDIAHMKGQGLSNQVVLERVNSTRTEFGEPPVCLTAIKNIPALVAKQRISDQLTTPEPKALSRIGRGTVRLSDLSESDCLTMAEDAAIREVWGVNEERGIGFDKIGRHKPSQQEKLYSRQFSAWKEGLNI